MPIDKKLAGMGMPASPVAPPPTGPSDTEKLTDMAVQKAADVGGASPDAGMSVVPMPPKPMMSPSAPPPQPLTPTHVPLSQPETFNRPAQGPGNFSSQVSEDDLVRQITGYLG